MRLSFSEVLAGPVPPSLSTSHSALVPVSGLAVPVAQGPLAPRDNAASAMSLVSPCVNFH